MKNTWMNKRSRSSPESTTTRDKKAKSEMTTKELLEAMEKRLKEHTKESEEKINANIIEQTKHLEQTLGSRISELETQILKMDEEHQETRARCNELERKLRQLDRTTRKNNIVITGMEAVTAVEADHEFQKIIPKTKLSNMRAIKTKNGTKVVATCENFESKMELMKAKRSIKTENGKQVFIDDDLSREDNELQFIVRQKAKSLKAEGKNVKIGQRKLNVEGKWIYIDEETKSFKSTDF